MPCSANKTGFILLLFCLACRKDEIPREVIQLTEHRMQAFRKEQDSICNVKATIKAEMAVDSFFLSFSQRFLLDTIQVPIKPLKPAVDTNIQLENGKPVKPLWDSLK